MKKRSSSFRMIVLILAMGAGLFALMELRGRLSTRPTTRATTRPVTENAADYYVEAFGAMPTSVEDKTELASAAELPLSNPRLVALCDEPLALLHLGARRKKCDWSTPYYKGLLLELPHLSPSRRLANAAVLRARFWFAKGEDVAGYTDLSDALVLARHVGRDKWVMPRLFQAATEASLIDQAAKHLMLARPQTLMDFEARLDALPAIPSMADVIRVEKMGMAGSARRLVEKGGLAKLPIPTSQPGLSRQQEVELVEGWASELEKLYDAMLPAMELPQGDYLLALAEWEARRSRGNPLIRSVPLSLRNTRDLELTARAKLAMLRAAIAIRREGPAAVGSSVDPFGNGPFGYREFPGGFELQSKLICDTGPVTLTVGVRPSPSTAPAP